jgi:predicted AAA+ superfamily ATPase
MTRIEWLLKGDPLYSLQVARHTAIAVPRETYTTRESTGPKTTNAEVTWSDRFEQMFTFAPQNEDAYLGQRAVMP